MLYFFLLFFNIFQLFDPLHKKKGFIFVHKKLSKNPTIGPTLVVYRGGDGEKGRDGIKLLINNGADRNSKGAIYTLRN